MKNINLYLVRHGQTEWNVANRMQGSQNSALTEVGVQGAKVTGKFLKDTPFMQAYASHLPRAMETRDYIVKENKLPIPVLELPDLSEMDFGICEGTYTPSLKDSFPQFNNFFNDPENFDATLNKGENYLDVLTRMQRAIKTIAQNAPQNSGNILVVSHGTALRLLLCVLSNKDWRLHRDEAYFPSILNTSISVINYQQKDEHSEGEFTISYINNVDHLK